MGGTNSKPKSDDSRSSSSSSSSRPHIESKEPKKQPAATAESKIAPDVSDEFLITIIPFIDENKFPVVLLPIIVSYLIENIADRHEYKYQPQIRFLGNMKALYESQAKQIAYNLVWQLHIEDTLLFAKHHQKSLSMVVKIQDPFGQWIEGTIVQILQAMGDRDPRALEPGEENYGLVERFRSCFLEGPHEYDRQLAEWRSRGEEGTKKIMEPYVRAIEILCQTIITDKKEICDTVPFETLLELPCAEQFRQALAPNPHHVVKSGLVWSWDIMLEFDKIWENKIKKLGDWGGLKSDLFAAIVYPSLCGRAPRCDFGLQKKGMGTVIAGGKLPERIDFSIIDSIEHVGFGRDFFFGYFTGTKWRAAVVAAGPAGGARACGIDRGFIKTYVEQKRQLWNYATPESSRPKSGDSLILGNRPAASAAGR